jgi:26S proteasome regulatory subunit N1
MAWQSAIVSLNAMLCTFIFSADITIVYADLKNILLCVSAFFSMSTLCMQLTILATAIVFILEHPFMDNASLPGWLDVNNRIVMMIVHYFADPGAKFGVSPTKEYWEWLKEASPRARGAKAK